MNTRFIELAGENNTAMPAYVVQKVGEALTLWVNLSKTAVFSYWVWLIRRMWMTQKNPLH